MAYNIIASNGEATVVSEYTPEPRSNGKYQSEAELEREFIRMLSEQGYQYISIRNEQELIDNLRRQLERLNAYTFSDTEWDQFFNKCIANENEGIVEKTRKIQLDHVQVLKRDDGSSKNIYLIDKKNIHKNCLQVINQYEETGGKRKARYDVTILVNGLPLIHIELKRRGKDLREAFNQIERYQETAFWGGKRLYEYVQIFVISNGTLTKYYSNSTRKGYLDEKSGRNSKKTSNSFKFTSYWADANNKPILDLVDFTRTFLTKHTILNVLTKYCVFTAEEMLLVMRPYQIAATERILNRILIAANYKKMGTIDAGGYIWHTTGSGKTLTSFKTAQLATAYPFIDKVLFVVDRKDLDYQTIKEYERFQKDAVNHNKSTRELQRQLENDEAKIIVTTIQKLDTFIKKNKSHPIYNKHVVIIFDECHRSQFGEMHKRITTAFKKYHIFGFTGTPIFAANASLGSGPAHKTTQQIFGDELHTYTIIDAIRDENVLPFKVDYVNTVKEKEGIEDEKVKAIDIEKALAAPERISKIVSYILEHFDQKTRRNTSYSLKGRRLSGFNSIFAVSSIPVCMKYYTEFKKQIEETGKDLVVATIFSFNPNDDPEEESFDTDSLDKSSRDFLESAIADYNKTFNTNYSTSADQFKNYYKDLSERVKNREVDILLVVNMFLTGFDATTVSTLWVDKNLRYHGLIQAFSRTNRILNSVKTYGNIVCFRNLEEAVDEAIGLFGDKNAGGIILLKDYKSYYEGHEDNGEYRPGYKELIAELLSSFPLGVLPASEKEKQHFIKLFGSILRVRNILASFDEFAGNEILSERDFQDYQGIYLNLYHEYSNREKADKEDIVPDLQFEIELIKQIEVGIDYILMMVEKYRESLCQDKSILVHIDKAISSSMQLRSKKELIERFIDMINVSSDVETDWLKYVTEQKEKDLEAIIAEENLKPEETKIFINNSLRDGALKTIGTEIDRILPPMSRFGGGRIKKKERVIEKLLKLFEQYYGLV